MFRDPKRIPSARKLSVHLLLLVALLIAVTGEADAAGKGEPGPVYQVRVELDDEVKALRQLSELDLDVDGVFPVSYTHLRAHET